MGLPFFLDTCQVMSWKRGEKTTSVSNQVKSHLRRRKNTQEWWRDFSCPRAKIPSSLLGVFFLIFSEEGFEPGTPFFFFRLRLKRTPWTPRPRPPPHLSLSWWWIASLPPPLSLGPCSLFLFFLIFSEEGFEPGTPFFFFSFAFETNALDPSAKTPSPSLVALMVDRILAPSLSLGHSLPMGSFFPLCSPILYPLPLVPGWVPWVVLFSLGSIGWIFRPDGLFFLSLHPTPRCAHSTPDRVGLPPCSSLFWFGRPLRSVGPGPPPPPPRVHTPPRPRVGPCSSLFGSVVRIDRCGPASTTFGCAHRLVLFFRFGRKKFNPSLKYLFLGGGRDALLLYLRSLGKMPWSTKCSACCLKVMQQRLLRY